MTERTQEDLEAVRDQLDEFACDFVEGTLDVDDLVGVLHLVAVCPLIVPAIEQALDIATAPPNPEVIRLLIANPEGQRDDDEAGLVYH